MIISVYAKKVLNIITHSWQKLNHLGIEGNFINLINVVYEKSTFNIFSGKILNSFPLWLDKKQGKDVFHR